MFKGVLFTFENQSSKSILLKSSVLFKKTYVLCGTAEQETFVDVHAYGVMKH